MCAFDSHCGYVTVENETATETATPVAASECTEYGCVRPRQTKEEADARKERRKLGYGKASELLIEAAVAARNDDAEKAKALVEIAQAWDSISY